MTVSLYVFTVGKITDESMWLQGKYFGPDSPCEEVACDEVSQLSSDISEASNSEEHAQNYHADASASFSAGDGVRHFLLYTA